MIEDRHIGNAAAARQAHLRTHIIAADEDIIEVAVRVHLRWTEKFAHVEARQKLARDARKGQQDQTVIEPRLLDAGQAQRRPVAAQCTAYGGRKPDVGRVRKFGEQDAGHNERGGDALPHYFAVDNLAANANGDQFVDGVVSGCGHVVG